jgi:hypothetical protein
MKTSSSPQPKAKLTAEGTAEKSKAKKHPMSSTQPGAKRPAFKLLMPQNNSFVDHYAVLDASCTATREEVEKSVQAEDAGL